MPSRGSDDPACPMRRVRGPGPQPNVAHHDLARRVSPRVPVHAPIRPDKEALSSLCKALRLPSLADRSN